MALALFFHLADALIAYASLQRQPTFYCQYGKQRHLVNMLHLDSKLLPGEKKDLETNQGLVYMTPLPLNPKPRDVIVTYQYCMIFNYY
jgi:hypothetical protein